MENPRFHWIDSTPVLSSFHPELHPIVARRLFNLGLKTDGEIDGFLNPGFYTPTPALEIPGMKEAADHIEGAIQKKQSICVWGDFDVDGQTSTAILISGLRKLGADVKFHVPVRGSETHGVNIPKLKEIIDEGAELILTCDTGITSHAAIEYANSRNVNVVITDHHDLPSVLPSAVAITNPKFLSVDHSLADLSGAGVTYKLIEELLHRTGMDRLDNSVDLAALGLVADMMKLRMDSRYLVQIGIQALRNTQKVGLTTMLEASDLNPSEITEEQISFNLAPKLNSLGRLSDANLGVELLTTDDITRAKVIVSIMEGLSAKSRLLSNQVFSAAKAQLSDNPSILNQSIIVLSHPTWPAGILGIVANRLVDHYNKPVILLSNPADEPARGSARSTKNFDLYKVISLHKDLLIQFGGHPMAAGLSIPNENIQAFKDRLNASIQSEEVEFLAENNLSIDGYISLDEVNHQLAETLDTLAPFGPGNTKPIIAIKNLTVQEPSRIGRYQDHIKFLVSDNEGNAQTVLWWNAGDEPLPEGKIDLAVNLNISDWKGQKQVQLVLVDYQPSEKENIVIDSPSIRIEDFRDYENPISIIQGLPDDSLIWLEGKEKNRLSKKVDEFAPNIKVVDRNHLCASSILAIWTAPPSQEILKNAVNIVKPMKIILLREQGEPSTPESFLEYLMGLIKFSITKKGGKTTYSELAAATAQNPRTLEKAISWLVSRGEIQLLETNGDMIRMTVGGEKSESSTSEGNWRELKQLLEETQAYRSFFNRAEKNSLIPPRN